MSTIQMTVGKRKLSAGSDPKAHAFWTNQLADMAAFSLRQDDMSILQESPLQRVASLEIPQELDARILRGTRNDHTAFEMFIISMVAQLVARSEATDDGVVWLAHMSPENVEQLLPCPFSLDPKDTLKTILGKMSKLGADILRYADYPQDLLIEAPQIAVAYVQDDQMPACTKDVSVVVTYRRCDGHAFIEFHARANAYSATTAQRFSQRLITLISKGIATPDAPMATFDLRTDQDQKLVTEINATDSNIAVSSLTALFDQTFDTCGDATAIIDSFGKAHRFQDLEYASRAVASQLLEAGFGKNQMVAVLAHRSFETIATIIGILRAGCAYLPIDPTLPKARIEYIFGNSGAKAAICKNEHLKLIPDGCVSFDLDQPSNTPKPRSALPIVEPDAAAYVIYTSGSTGRPKGVLIEHDSVVNRLKWMQDAYPISSQDRLIQKTPLTFDVSVWELFWWLIEGATLVIPEPGVEKEPAALMDTIHKHGVTTMHFVPTMLGVFMTFLKKGRETQKVTSLRQVFTSGEALQPHHTKSFLEALPQTRLINLYGPTEATVDVSHYEVTAVEPVVPIGRPIANTGLHILDEHFMPCGVGMTGELYLSGRGLAREYVNNPQLTACRFLNLPQVTEDRLYKTGDLARWRDDGTVEYLGRNDFQAKLRGFRIELGEIEALLMEHPDVTDSIAVISDGEDGQQHLWAYVTGGAELQESALKSQLAQSLPDYMLPERIAVLEVFPLSQSGKLDRKGLPTPDNRRATYVAPQTETERALVEIWQNVLSLEKIGVIDNFFSLGGNSIHFVSVLAMARAQNLNFSFQQLFRHPTIRDLSQEIETSCDAPVAIEEFEPFALISDKDRTRIPDGVEDAYPLSMLQAGLIFQSEVMYGNTSYHDIVSFMIQGEMDPVLFSEAVKILVQENPIFRTSYQLNNHDQYLQYIHADIDELPLVIDDMRGRVAEEDWDTYYTDWFKTEQNRAFEWDRPGLVRLHIHIMADDVFRYSISQHNSMLDGWSMNQAHVKLFSIYLRLRDGVPHVSNSVNTHLRNFIGMELEAIASPKFKSFWADHLKDAPKTDVPRLRPIIERDDIDVAFRDIELPDGLSDGLIDLAQRLNVPVKTVLLAAHLRVLSTLSGQSDVFTGYEIGGRPELPGAETALGVFLNTMPLRLDLAAGSWRDLILQTFETEAEVLPFRRYPMAQVKQDRATTDLLFETVFNFTHFYSLKELRKMPEFSLLDVRAAAITEFPLRVEVSQHFYTDDVNLSLHYHTASFDEAQIMRIGEYFVAALNRMVASVDAPHHTQTLIPETEQQEIANLVPSSEESAKIVDTFGQLVPIGVPGVIASTTQRVKRLTNGRVVSLQMDQTLAELTKKAPIQEDELSGPALEIAAIWSELLNRPVSDFGPSTDFFEIGGNSMMALKLVLKLKGRLSLRDLMQHSRLSEMACKIAAPAAPKDHRILVNLAGDESQGSGLLVCLPYAGGDASHFRDFSHALNALESGLSVVAADLPGHSFTPDRSELMAFETTIDTLADEIQARATGPVYVWGHCVGSAIALALAEELTRRGDVDLRQVFIAAKILPAVDEIAQTLQNARDLVFDDIHALYQEWAGDDGLATVGKDFQDFMVSVFRHDSLQSNGFLMSRIQRGAALKIDAPVTLIVSRDDPATEAFDANANSWAALVPHVQTHIVLNGGHYFLGKQPKASASVVQSLIADSRPEAKLDMVLQ
ncbi:MAG: amino acid adenylation domain-containing protein [Pseudoruegeria sp.]